VTHARRFNLALAVIAALATGAIALVAVLAPVPAAAQQAAAPAPPKIPIEPLPASPPAWLTGYRIRYPLRVVGDPAAQATAATVMARLPAGGWLKPDGSDIAVQNAVGQPIPVSVLSHDPGGDTVMQFARSANDKWYWAYAGNPAAPPAAATTPPAPEGLVAEFRQWAGDPIDTWANVVEGLKKSETVIGNAVLAEVISTMNPARPSEPRNYAASYRGFLNIKTAGAYRFVVNAQDASFLFIDGHKVLERGGHNERLERAAAPTPLSKTGTLIDLAAGVHPFEVHHVLGDNPANFGFCVLLWVPPGAKQWAYVPPDAFAQPLLATAADVQEAAGGQVATIGWGIDDVLTTIGQTLYLVRFEAQGTVTDPAQLAWDFGDGTTAAGRSVTHVYFKEGPYAVKLTSGANLPPAQRTVAIWNAPVVSSPFSAGKAVRAIGSWDLAKLDAARLRQAFNFLRVCEQTDHWPVLEKVARQVLASAPNGDPQARAAAHAAMMESMAAQGNAEQALAHADEALKEFAKTPSLQVRVKLQAADVSYRHLRDVQAAAKTYRAILEENRRLKIPEVRLAAIRLGDLFAETGEMPEAADAYRLAATLGGAEFDATAQTGAVTRGAMLRVAEQRLRTGDLAQTRQLMEKIEVNYPEQKLEGLYRFLRAEADRAGGRYEDAIGHYEVLLRLPQWGGYRSKALFGIADSHARAGELAKAVEWLDTLEESFPTFYDEQDLPGYRRSIEARLARSRRAGGGAGAGVGAGAGGAASAGFTGFATGFEPDDKLIGDSLTSCLVVRGLGMGGGGGGGASSGHVGLIESPAAVIAQSDWAVRLRDVQSGGYAWVELWYRETRNSLPANSHTHAWLYGTGTDLDPLKGQGSIYWNYTYGQWRKLGYLVRAPDTRDGRAATSVRQVWGAVEIDALSVTPVTDRQYDAMLNFAQRDGAE